MSNRKIYKVYSEMDGIVYRGQQSVRMLGNRVWIDGQEVGVEVDNNGDPLLPEALPIIELPQVPPSPVAGSTWQGVLVEAPVQMPRRGIQVNRTKASPVPSAPHAASLPSIPDTQAREMFGCTTQSIDLMLQGKDPRDIAMYAMGVLSNAQELFQRAGSGESIQWSVPPDHANRVRQLMNIAKYAIDRAVPRSRE